MAVWRSAVVVSGLLLSGSAAAQTAGNIEQLEQELKAMQEQMRTLQRRVEDARATAAAAQAAADAAEARSAAAEQAQWRAEERAASSKSSSSSSDDLDLKVKWKGAPEFSSKDGRFKMKVRGRLQTDYNAINQDTGITGRPNVSAAEIRRARLGVEGLLWQDVEYKFEVDFANDETALKDAYMEYVGLCEGLGIRVGNFKNFNSLEHMTSSRYITFMERAAFIDAFELDRQIGAGVIFDQKHYTISAGVYGPHAENDSVWLDDVKSGAARVTWAPVNEDRRVVHFGASWRSRHGGDDLRANPIPANDQFFQYRARGADLHLADRFIGTPQIFNEDAFWGLEAAVVYGSWSLQGEYAQLHPDVATGFVGPDPTYQGWYIEGSWYITGESRTYKNGEFDRPKVLDPVFEGGRGAWQLAAKYDVLDLSDKATMIATCTTCGNQETWLLGVNWWLNDHTRVIFDYNQSKITGGFMGGANVNDGATIRGFGTRAQVDW